MSEYLIYTFIGLVMGMGGGLIGIGGSIIMIPLMVIFFGENQHLYQAAAMICNAVVGLSAAISHWRARKLIWPVLRWMVPTALAGVLVGVWASNTSVFEGERSYLLARVFALFLFYVAGFNLLKMYRHYRGHEQEYTELDEERIGPVPSGATGVVTGFFAGLLGIGAGGISTPMQHFWMRMPLRRAMANSSACMVPMALIGALYKNLTLAQHDINPMESLKMAVFLVPTAFVGGLIGGHVMHKLPRPVIRTIFIIVVTLAGIKLITVR